MRRLYAKDLKFNASHKSELGDDDAEGGACPHCGAVPVDADDDSDGGNDAAKTSDAATSKVVSLKARRPRAEKQAPTVSGRGVGHGLLGKRFNQTDMTSVEALARAAKAGHAVVTMDYIRDVAKEHGVMAGQLALSFAELAGQVLPTKAALASARWRSMVNTVLTALRNSNHTFRRHQAAAIALVATRQQHALAVCQQAHGALKSRLAETEVKPVVRAAAQQQRRVSLTRRFSSTPAQAPGVHASAAPQQQRPQRRQYKAPPKSGPPPSPVTTPGHPAAAAPAAGAGSGGGEGSSRLDTAQWEHPWSSGTAAADTKLVSPTSSVGHSCAPPSPASAASTLEPAAAAASAAAAAVAPIAAVVIKKPTAYKAQPAATAAFPTVPAQAAMAGSSKHFAVLSPRVVGANSPVAPLRTTADDAGPPALTASLMCEPPSPTSRLKPAAAVVRSRWGRQRQPPSRYANQRSALHDVLVKRLAVGIKHRRAHTRGGGGAGHVQSGSYQVMAGTPPPSLYGSGSAKQPVPLPGAVPAMDPPELESPPQELASPKVSASRPRRHTTASQPLFASASRSSIYSLSDKENSVGMW